MKERMKRLEDKLTKETTSRQNEVGGLQNKIGGLQNKIGGLQNKIGGLENKVGGLQNENGGLQNKVTNLEHQVKDLKLASDGYRRLRNRFINVYRRDVLGDVSHQEYQQISDGNNAAHGGDAVTDASLYTSWERNDEDVFIHLYGLSSNQISYQGKCQTSLPKCMRSQAYAL
jgi:polyhydroxyalkanoate synthesis regulator phasin